MRAVWQRVLPLVLTGMLLFNAAEALRFTP